MKKVFTLEKFAEKVIDAFYDYVHENSNFWPEWMIVLHTYYSDLKNPPLDYPNMLSYEEFAEKAMSEFKDDAVFNDDEWRPKWVRKLIKYHSKIEA